MGFPLQAGALPRLCDVLRVLQEERAQCAQELSREKTGDLGPETVSGRRLPQPRGTPQLGPILASGGSGLSSGPSGLSRVSLGLSTPSAVRSGTWSQWTWKLPTSFVWSASAFSPSASAHTVYKGEGFLMLVYKSLSVCTCMECVYDKCMPLCVCGWGEAHARA